jgi:hypothetical protein
MSETSVLLFILYALLKKDVIWTWSEEAQEAFNTLKEKLSKFPILRRPHFNKVFILHTNLSVISIGAIIGQLDKESKEYVIAYASQSNKEVGSNYSLYEGGRVLFLYGSLYILGLIFMAPSSLCIPTANLSSGWWPMTNLLVS